MTVVPFKRPEPPDEEMLLFEASVYGKRNGDRRVLFTHPDGARLDPQYIADEMLKVTQSAHEQLNDPALALVLVLASGRTRTIWIRTEFETPRQLAWLRRRFRQSYWDIDERRGVRYFLSSFLTTTSRLVERLRARKGA